MIQYLLDTDITSYLMKRKFPALQARVRRLQLDTWAISAVSYGELLFGLQQLHISHPARSRALDFLDYAQVLDWPVNAAIPYADIRHRTRKQPIGDRDSMIAAHAIAVGCTLVTNNTRHFNRIGDPLRLENWLDSPPITSA